MGNVYQRELKKVECIVASNIFYEEKCFPVFITKIFSKYNVGLILNDLLLLRIGHIVMKKKIIYNNPHRFEMSQPLTPSYTVVDWGARGEGNTEYTTREPTSRNDRDLMNSLK